jgi:hypothetical protein
MCRPDYDPDHPLETRVGDYLTGRLESRKDEINWFLLREKLDWDEVTARARRLAEVLLSGVASLGWFDDQDELDRLLQDRPEGDSEAAKIERLCEIETIDQLLAERAIAATKNAETRFWELLRHVSMTRSTSPRGRAFLKRISLCYMFGFDAECIVMCRAVLDAEFQANIPTDDCIQTLGADNRRTNRHGQPLYDLAERILVAEKTRRTDYATKDKAQRVVRRGNHVVHRDPGTQQHEALETITDTLAVIDALSS